MGPFKDIGVEKTGHVPLVEIRRPPHNYGASPAKMLRTLNVLLFMTKIIAGR
jgi:hypothetical protein